MKRVVHPSRRARPPLPHNLLSWLTCWTLLTSLLLPRAALPLPVPGDGPPQAGGILQNTGENVLAFPIPVPPATGGFAPMLALRYSSGAGDGPFGAGWKLEFGEIRRSLRFGIPSFDDAADAFELAGEMLVPNPAESRPGRTRYHALTERFSRVLHVTGSGQDLWEVTQPDGTILRFGADRDSRVLRDGASGPIARWLLREMEDPHGNVIRFSHLIEEGADYPLRVEFSFRGATPVGRLREVEFRYEARPDPSVTYLGGVRRALRQRAREIIIRSGSEIFRRIELRYSDEITSGKRYRNGRSRLAELQVFGAGGRESLPAQRFTYRDPADDAPRGGAARAFTADRSLSLPRDVNLSLGVFFGDSGDDRRTLETNPVRFADVDGDGQVDIARAFEDKSGKIVQEVYLGGGGQFTLDRGWSQALALDPAVLATAGRALRGRQQKPAGSGDACFIPAAEIVPVPNPVLFASAAQTSDFAQKVPGVPDVLEVSLRATWELVDVNGDGRADLLSGYRIADFFDCAGRLQQPGTRVSEVWLNTGSGWQRDPVRAATLPEFGLVALASTTNSYLVRLRAEFVELNGDRGIDLAVERTTVSPDARPDTIALEFLRQGANGAWARAPEYNMGLTPNRFTDLNGDGLTDGILTTASQPGAVFLNTGVGFCGDTRNGAMVACVEDVNRFRPPVPLTSQLQFADVNGDGSVDLIQRAGSASRTWLHDPAAPGGSVFVEDPQFTPPDSGGVLIDADSDGALDFLDRSGGRSFRGTLRFPDRLSRFENETGAVVAYDYDSAARQRDAALDARADRVITKAAGSLRLSAAPVLASRSVSGPGLQPFSERFAYARPRFIDPLRMSLGFALVRRTIGGSAQIFYFTQQLGLAGQLARRETLDPATGALLAQEDRRFEVFAGNDRAVGAGSMAGALVGRLAERSESTLYGPPGAEVPGAVTRESFEYGSFGVVTKITSRRPSGTSVTTRTPRPPDLERWIVQLPETESASDGRRELRRARFRYNDAGDPIEVTEFEGPRGGLDRAVPRTTVRSFDEFGNLRVQIDPGQRVIAFCYDGDSGFAGGPSCESPTDERTHSALVSTRDRLGQITASRPDPVTGQPLETLRRYSGERNGQRYDPFGRLIETRFQPAGGAEIVLAQINHVDLPESPIGQPFVETLTRTESAGTDTLRSASYLDGLGQVVRSVSEAPRGSGETKRFMGTATRLDRESRQLVSSFPGSCGADPHCRALLQDRTPRTIEQGDGLGRPLSSTTPEGVSLFDYRSAERTHPDSGPGRFDAVLVRDARGALVQRILDRDHVLWVEECANSLPAARVRDLPRIQCERPDVTFYRYEASGELAEVYRPGDTLASAGSGKPSLRFVYDSLGREIETHDRSKDGITAIIYDAAGEIDKQLNARGQMVDFDRDPLGRPTRITYPVEGGNREYAFRYDPRTREPDRIEQTQLAPARRVLTLQEFGYDSLGRRNRETLTVGESGEIVTEAELDLLGRATHLRTPDAGTALGYRYEGAFLRQVCELGSARSCTESGVFAYLSRVEYDEIGREHELTGAIPASGASPRLSLQYDPASQRLEHLELTPGAGPRAERLDLRYRYDELGNILSVTDGSPRVGADDVSLGVSYTYDGRNRLLTRQRGADTRHFGYDALGNLTGNATASPAESNQTYDPQRPGRLLEAQGRAYAYDADGNVTRRGEQAMRFDAMGRLDCTGTQGSCAESFLYGPDGQRLAALRGGTPVRIFAGQLFEWEPATGAATVRIPALGRQIAYKRVARAELREASTGFGAALEPWTPLLHFAVRMTSFLICAAVLMLLLRAGLWRGIRLRPLVAAVGLPLTVLLIAPPALWAAPLPTDRGTYRRFIWEDRLGSAVHITDEAGVVVAQRAFEPFGQIAAERSTEPTERAFAGHRFEDGSGLYFLQARWYDPAAGRFLSVDPLVRNLFDPQSLNPYSYVENDPVNLVDPSGLAAEDPDDIEEIVIRGRREPADPFGPGGRFFDPFDGFDEFGRRTRRDSALDLDDAFSATAMRREATAGSTRSSAGSRTTLVVEGLVVGGLLLLTAAAFAFPFDGPAGDAVAASLFASRAGPFLARLSLLFAAGGGAATTTVFRVESAANQRIAIGAGGQVAVRGNGALFLNFGDAARAEAFLAKRIAQGFTDSSIKSFQVPTSFANELARTAVPEALARRFPNSPFVVDITQALNQFGLRAPQIEALQRAIIQGTGTGQ